jgi:hypothetical protein
MKSRLTVLLAGVVVLAAPHGFAQSTGAAPDPAALAHEDALASIRADRGAVIGEIVDRWQSQFHPFDAALNVGGEEERLTAALKAASPEKLLAVSQAATFEEVLTTLFGSGPSIIPLGPGPIPNVLGSSTADLVFTPVTPCRIIDTRNATNPTLAGPIGPNSGKQFSVSLANYATQGGFAGSCGIPIAPAAVAINVTSTGQAGLGNLRVVEVGGGIPTVSLLNYSPGVNLANAAVARSAGTLGGVNIFIYSGGSTSQVVVDIMGYYAAPVATALACLTTANTATVEAAGASFSLNAAACPAGYTSVSVNCRTSGFNTVNYASMGVNTGGAQCQGTNTSGSTITMNVSQQCCRVPGR